MSNKVIAASLGIEYVPEDADDTEEFSPELPVSPNSENSESSENDPVAELLGPEKDVGHVEQDYLYAREKMKTFLEFGETGLKDLMEFVKDDKSARGYEVLGTMLSTVTDMATKFFDLQKKNKELHMGSLSNITGKPDIAIRNGIVYTGDSAGMLEHLKEKRRNEQDGTES